MSFALGSALMARDVSRERKDLREEERRLQKASEDAAKAQQKKGMWGSIGSTLGSMAVGAALTPVLGPGALVAAKAAGSYLGGRLGQGAINTSKEYDALKSQAGKGNFLSSERQMLKDYGTDEQKAFKEATSGMRKQLAMKSATQPLMQFAASEGLEGIKGLGSADAWSVGKGAGAGWENMPSFSGSGRFNPVTGEEFMSQAIDPSTGMPATELQYTGPSIWDRLASSPEFSAFYPTKKDEE
jgi:hypothetical protein